MHKYLNIINEISFICGIKWIQILKFWQLRDATLFNGLAGAGTCVSFNL